MIYLFLASLIELLFDAYCLHKQPKRNNSTLTIVGSMVNVSSRAAYWQLQTRSWPIVRKTCRQLNTNLLDGRYHSEKVRLRIDVNWRRSKQAWCWYLEYNKNIRCSFSLVSNKIANLLPICISWANGILDERKIRQQEDRWIGFIKIFFFKSRGLNKNLQRMKPKLMLSTSMLVRQYCIWLVKACERLEEKNWLRKMDLAQPNWDIRLFLSIVSRLTVSIRCWECTEEFQVDFPRTDNESTN